MSAFTVSADIESQGRQLCSAVFRTYFFILSLDMPSSFFIESLDMLSFDIVSFFIESFDMLSLDMVSLLMESVLPMLSLVGSGQKRPARRRAKAT